MNPISYLLARRDFRRRQATLRAAIDQQGREDALAIRAVLASADIDVDDASLLDHVVVLVRENRLLQNQLHTAERRGDRLDSARKIAERELRNVHDELREVSGKLGHVRMALGVEPFEEDDLVERVGKLIDENRALRSDLDAANSALADIAVALFPGHDVADLTNDQIIKRAQAMFA